jgi:signal transduction histidine kinase/ActR/RegA family two-component response regulator
LSIAPTSNRQKARRMPPGIVTTGWAFSYRSMVALTAALLLPIVVGDFLAPGELNVAILYTLPVAMAGWTRSRRFLWLTTVLCVSLTYGGLALGPKPSVSELGDAYLNRSFTAIGLLMLAAMLHQRMRMLGRLAAARLLEMRQNEMLRAAETRLHQVNAELMHRVDREVERRVETEQQLHQAQKMEALGQLTGGITHDFNNVLTIVMGNLERIATRSSRDDIGRLARNALRGAEQGARLTRHLLGFARRQPLEPQVLEVDDVLRGVLALAHRAVNETVQLSLECRRDVWRFCADPAQLESALLNLVLNARDAMPAGGHVEMAAENASVERESIELARGDYVRFSVSDTGSGMTPAVAARALEPFFTTKGAGKGSGLGLAMAYGFAKQSGGTLRIESAVGEGTTVYIYLPRTTMAPNAAANAAQTEIPAAPLPATVLIVEGDDGVRQVAAESLGELGYRTLEAQDGRAAVSVLERNTVDLLLTDVAIPGGMSGIDLAKEARRANRSLPVLLMTGHAQLDDEAVTRIGTDVTALLPKPFLARDLALKVHEMLDSTRGPRGAITESDPIDHPNFS